MSKNSAYFIGGIFLLMTKYVKVVCYYRIEVRRTCAEMEIDMECSENSEKITVRLSNPMLYDRLYNLAAEYSVSVEFLVNVAIQRLVGDVDFIRNLRQNVK